MNEREQLLVSISDIIADYREGEIEKPNPEHIDRWVKQFEPTDQIIIPQEMARILPKYYISKSRIFRGAEMLLDKLFKNFPLDNLRQTKFLTIARKGTSQQNLLGIIDAILNLNYGIGINECGTDPKNYLYVDDCLFSGNTALYDLKQWAIENPAGNEIMIAFLVSHKRGLQYLINTLINTMVLKNISSIRNMCLQEIDNTPTNNSVEYFWPQEVTDDMDVSNYTKNLTEQSKYTPRLFRPKSMPTTEKVFSSPIARQVVEKAFLKAGAYIVTLPQQAKFEMRPMGYEKLDSLGFGAFTVTYRNCSNNCPLVWWWGDTNRPSSHPFSKWYPLFPRKVNE